MFDAGNQDYFDITDFDYPTDFRNQEKLLVLHPLFQNKLCYYQSVLFPDTETRL